MLADIVTDVALRGDPVKFPYLRPELADAMRLAQRFAVDLSFTAAASQIHQSNPTSLLAALPLCRVPYPKIWIERAGAIGDPTWDDVFSSDAPAPKRFGVLVEIFDPDGTMFQATFYWQHPNDGPPMMQGLVACPLMVLMTTNAISIIDTLATLPTGRHPWLDFAKNKMQAIKDHAKRVAANSSRNLTPDQRAASAELESRAFCAPSLYHYDAMRYISANEKGWYRDIANEGGLLLAELALLNSRTNVTHEPVDLSRLNKSRRQGGKRDLLSYSVVKIKLSAREQAAAATAGMSAADIRKHLVRGHFKIRKSGVYWWRPFIRGRGPGEVRHQHYDVSA